MFEIFGDKNQIKKRSRRLSGWITIDKNYNNAPKCYGVVKVNEDKKIALI